MSSRSYRHKTDETRTTTCFALLPHLAARRRSSEKKLACGFEWRGDARPGAREGRAQVLATAATWWRWKLKRRPPALRRACEAHLSLPLGAELRRRTNHVADGFSASVLASSLTHGGGCETPSLAQRAAEKLWQFLFGYARGVRGGRGGPHSMNASLSSWAAGPSRPLACAAARAPPHGARPLATSVSRVVSSSHARAVRSTTRAVPRPMHAPPKRRAHAARTRRALLATGARWPRGARATRRPCARPGAMRAPSLAGARCARVRGARARACACPQSATAERMKSERRLLSTQA